METVRFCDTLTSTESVERSAYLQGALLVVSTGCHAGQLYTSALPAAEVPMRGPLQPTGDNNSMDLSHENG